MVQREAGCSEDIEQLLWLLRSTSDGRESLVHDRDLTTRWEVVPTPALGSSERAELSQCAYELECMSGYAQGVVQSKMRELAKRLRSLIHSDPNAPREDQS